MVDECEDDWGPDLHGGLGLALRMHTEKLTWTLMMTDAGSQKMRRWVSFICYSKFICYLANTDDSSLTRSSENHIMSCHCHITFTS